MIIPEKLHPGDTLCVVAPSASLSVVSEQTRQIASETLARLGLQVTFSRNAGALDQFHSSPAALRLDDLHQAFLDPQVKGILSALGGYNCNQLLRLLDYDLIRRHPKVLCGFSDITALSSAIYARTGLVSYSGPHFCTFGMRHGLEYTLDHFRRCLMESEPFNLEPSETWSDDAWYRDQEKREHLPNPGYLVIQEGQAQGTLLGGNLCTLNLLQGTEYMPSLENTILLLEDDSESRAGNFDRDLQSLLHLPGFTGVRGLVIGRFQKDSHIEDQALVEIIRSKPELNGLPVIANANLGHCTPQFTFPIGGAARLAVEAGQVAFTITEH